ncbi:MAG TPA: PAS domain S-box protein [Thermoanaerobaculia bacterium]|nr:PAS domain S-box protein [Thermoanaerobaculia bacterium]
MSNEHLAALVETAPIAIIALDRQRRVLTWNRAAEQLFGWTAAEVVGEISPLIPPERAEEHAQIRDAVWSGGSVRNLKTERVHRGGSRIPVEVSTSAARDKAGIVIASIGIYVDRSEIRDAERRLRVAYDTQARRAAQQQAVATFSRRAVLDRDADEIRTAALVHVMAALQANGAEILQHTPDGFFMRTQFGFVADACVIAAGNGSVFDEVMESHLPVSRPLLEADFAAAPHLRENGFHFVAAYGASCHGTTGIVAAYSREHPFDLGDLYPLQSIASMLGATMSRRAAERELASQELRLRLLVEQLPAILWSVDRNLVVTALQGAAVPSIGRVPEETIGRNLLELRVHQQGIDAMHLALEGNETEYRYEQNGRTFDTRVQPLRDPDGDIVGAIALSMDVTERTVAEQQAIASREQLRRLNVKLSEIQENERRRIARELHDELGQELTALRFETALLRDELQNGIDSSARRLESMLVMIDDAIGSTRRVATELRPAVLDDFGFRAALEHEVRSFARRTGIEATVRFVDDPALEIDRATALYRITQEALTNVARHSHAGRVTIVIERIEDALRAEITDDGCGIDASAAREPASLGLIGMRERAHTFGGTVTIEGAPGRGTSVVVRLPLQPL